MDRIRKRPVKPSRKLSLRRLSVYVGASLGTIVLTVGVLIVVFGSATLNRYGKGAVERAFAKAHPGYALRIGRLDYALVANRMVAQSVSLSTTNTTLRVARVSVTGARWVGLLRGRVAVADVLAKASLDATNIVVEFPRAQYGIHCTRLRMSVPVSELIAEGTELRPLAEDDAFFAAQAFRRTRFRVVLPECRVLGLAFREALQRSSYRALSVQFSRPRFDALVDLDKPLGPFVKSPMMVHEALATIRPPLKVKNLSITNGHFSYCERLAPGAPPAMLTFDAVSVSVEDIANRGEATTAIHLRGQGDLMNAGTLKVQMSIPITPPDFSLRYSGSLGAMDLTRLNAFLETAQHIRIKSGSAQEAEFEIEVTAGQATGHVRATYRDLEITILDKQTGTEKGFDNRVASFLAKLLTIRSANPPEGSGSRKEGKVDYARGPDEEFQEFVWYALRTGVLDVISH